MERYSGALKPLVEGGEVSRSLSRSPLQPSSRDVTKKQSSVRFARGATRARAPYCIAPRGGETDEKEKVWYGTRERKRDCSSSLLPKTARSLTHLRPYLRVDFSQS